MKTVETIAKVSRRGSLVAHVPADITPGEHQVVLIISETSDAGPRRAKLKIPVVRVGRWPAGLSLRREDMYGDNGR